MDKSKNHQTDRSATISWEHILENAFDEIYLFDDEDLNFVQVSKGALHNLGYNLQEIQQLTPLDIKPDFTEKELQKVLQALREGKQNMKMFKTRHRRKDGSFYPVEIRLQFVSESQPPLFLAISHDLSEQKQADEALRTNQALFSEAQRIAHIGSCEMDMVNNTVRWSDEIYRILELDPEETVPCYTTFLAAIHPDDRDRFSKAHDRSIEQQRPYDILYRMSMKDGRQKYIHQYCEPRCDKNNKVIRTIHTVQDVTQSHQADLAQQKLNRSLKALSACNEAMMKVTDETELLNKVCDIIVTLAGYRLAWVGFIEKGKEKTVRPVAYAGYLESRQNSQNVGLVESDNGQNPINNENFAGITNNIQDFTPPPQDTPWMETPGQQQYGSSVALPLSENNDIFGVLNIYAAETDKFNEEEVQLLQKLVDNLAFGIRTLRTQSEREQLQRQLEQSQKMEAIGQLAGGIAHDYNNWLGVIIGYLDFLKDYLVGNEEPYKWVEAAMKASQHSANLTRQLLAFSRQQATTKSLTDINKTIREMDDLIERSVTPEVAVAYRFQEPLWQVEINPNEFNDAILNLVSNARSAMPEGGKLIIDTKNRVLDSAYTSVNPGLKPGEYVVLALSDTGIGMTKAVQARVFEPFFTTKPEGKGAGLGLAMVYGFAKRYGGHSTVLSKPDAGTTFEIFLPRSKTNDTVDHSIESNTVIMPTGREILLIVDDEVELLNLVDKVLSDLGYQTRLAENASQALRILADDGKIDLLFSDVVMPGGINGYELAKKAVELRPGLKILLTSGFTPKTAIQEGVAQFSANLLSKPYHKVDLAQRIRYVLDLK